MLVSIACFGSVVTRRLARVLSRRGGQGVGSAMPLPVITAAERAEALTLASSDLRYHFAEIGVDEDVQAAVYRGGFTSLRLFAGLDETRAAVKACLANDFGLDAAADLATRRRVALVLAAWESSKDQVLADDRCKVEARSNHLPRPVGTTEHAAMRSAVEAALGPLREAEVPSKSFVGLRLEQVDNNEPKVEDLREVTSVEDGESEYMMSVIDHASGAVKVKRGTISASAPLTPEDLRMRHRRIGLAWCFVLTKHTNRPWLLGTSVEDYRQLSDHVLGAQVKGLESKSESGQVICKPSWAQVLHYDYEVRKFAYAAIRNGTKPNISSALKEACRDFQTLQLHLVGPMMLCARAERDAGASSGPGLKRKRTWDEAPEDSWRKPIKGKGKGKGKNSEFKVNGLYTKIPQSGKLICFAFQKGTCKGSCGKEHVCQQCLGNHAITGCGNRPRGKGGDTAEAKVATEAF
jgi:hypothetical protein